MRAVIHSERVEIYVLYVAGVPAGFSELDRHRKAEVELVHLGMIPEFAGRGLGDYLLGWAIDQAWSKRARRMWTHITNHDHPQAIAVFQRAGFAPTIRRALSSTTRVARGRCRRGRNFPEFRGRRLRLRGSMMP